MKILELRAENFKRLSVVEITPQGRIVEITGANGEGKTSTLDAIWAALGGKNAIPEQPIRVGHETARIQVKLGEQPGAPVYIVERKFTPKDSYIKVTDAAGSKHAKPETILKGLMGEIGFDPLAFMRMDAKQHYEVLRGLVKIDVDIDALNRKRATLYEERTAIGRDLKSAEGAVASIAVPADLPDEAPDIAAITERLANVDKHNSGIRELGVKRDQIAENVRVITAGVDRFNDQIVELQRQIATIEAGRTVCLTNFSAASASLEEAERIVTSAGSLVDPAEIASELQRASVIEEGFRLQKQKIDASARVSTLTRQQEGMSAEIDAIDKTKQRAIAEAKMPIDGLAFADDSVVFKGLSLAAASSAEQLRVSAAIGAALNPKLRVLLVRDGSLLDSKSFLALSQFAETADMQIWVEKVDESGEVGVVLVDGHIKGQEAMVEAFERDEATQSESQSGNVTQSESSPPVDEARMKRVEDYINGKLAELPARRTVEELERDNAEVKIKLAKFPEIITGRWNGPYLEATRTLHGRKT